MEYSGYHKLYSNEVQKQIDGIANEMSDKRNSLIISGMDTMMADAMVKAESQEKVRNFVDELRVMNQDGIDMYKKSNISGNEYLSQDEYGKYFDEKLKNAKSKCGH